MLEPEVCLKVWIGSQEASSHQGNTVAVAGRADVGGGSWVETSCDDSASAGVGVGGSPAQPASPRLITSQQRYHRPRVIGNPPQRLKEPESTSAVQHPLPALP